MFVNGYPEHAFREDVRWIEPEDVPRIAQNWLERSAVLYESVAMAEAEQIFLDQQYLEQDKALPLEIQDLRVRTGFVGTMEPLESSPSVTGAFVREAANGLPQLNMTIMHTKSGCMVQIQAPENVEDHGRYAFITPTLLEIEAVVQVVEEYLGAKGVE